MTVPDGDAVETSRIQVQVPLSQAVLLALCANAYETGSPLGDWIDWALRVKYGSWPRA